MNPGFIILLVLILLILFLGLVTVGQGTVAVVTMFGKYRRVLHAGLNFKLFQKGSLHKIDQ